MQYGISPKAYGKIVYHCAKYPHRAVNGVILGTFAKKDNRVNVQDSVPLFHNDLDLTAMLEVALSQVEIYANSKGLSIVGYYVANESLEGSLSEAAQSIGNKVFGNTEQSCILLVDNTSIFTSPTTSAMKMYLRTENSNNWKEQSKCLVLDGDDNRIHKLLSSLQNGSYMKLVDFDSHLDSCVDTDWTNPTVNTLIDEQSSN